MTEHRKSRLIIKYATLHRQPLMVEVHQREDRQQQRTLGEIGYSRCRTGEIGRLSIRIILGNGPRWDRTARYHCRAKVR